MRELREELKRLVERWRPEAEWLKGPHKGCAVQAEWPARWFDEVAALLADEAPPLRRAAERLKSEGLEPTAEDTAELVRTLKASALPLMARRDNMIPGVSLYATVIDGKIDHYSNTPGSAWPGMEDRVQVYRIVDTDEHGFEVVPRTADMPLRATHRITWLDDGSEQFTDKAPVALEANRSGGRSERIEDYTEQQP